MSYLTTIPKYPPDRFSGWMRLWMLLITLLAFGLRAYHLDFQSFWSDEGISLIRSSQPLGQMWRTMPIEHVPGYFVLLHFWIGLTGKLDYGLRFLSLLPSMWAVVLIARLGADLGSRRAGLIAALLLATGGFQVWYAQEVRMYSWLLATSLYSTWSFWWMLTRPDDRPWTMWLGYVISTTATIYLHYFGFLLPITQSALIVLWLTIEQQWRPVRRWIGAGAVIFLLFIPWLTRALSLLEFSGWRAPLDPLDVPWMLLSVYSVGDTMPTPWAEWLPWLYLLLAMIGAVTWWRRNRTAGWFLTANLLLLVTVLLLLVTRNPDFHVRYTIVISPALLLLVAGGIAGLGHSWWKPKPASAQKQVEAIPTIRTVGRHALPWTMIIALVAANGLALQRLYTDTSLHKPNFRTAAQRIQSQEKPGDIVLVDGPNPKLVFLHYYEGDTPVYDLRYLQDVDDEMVAAEIATLTEDAARAWELLYFHAPDRVQVWLATHAWPTTPSFHNDIRVLLYGLDPGTANNHNLSERPINIRFGDALELETVTVDGPTAHPGDLLRVTTRWQVHSPPPDYKFSLRLQNAAAKVVQAVDYVPQNWFAPTSLWTVGSPAVDQHALLLSEDLAPGPYQVTLRLYDPATGIAVDTPSGPDVVLAAVDVVAVDIAE